jgi:mRNA-degrading endonuclease RelE of RelBE toxin-antitoxin system
MRSSWRQLSHDLGIVWLPGAMTAFRTLRDEDPDGAALIANAIAALRTDPRPEHSTALGKTEFRRLRVDRYRVLYELTATTVRVMHVGSVHDRQALACWYAIRGHLGSRRLPSLDETAQPGRHRPDQPDRSRRATPDH